MVFRNVFGIDTLTADERMHPSPPRAAGSSDLYSWVWTSAARTLLASQRAELILPRCGHFPCSLGTFWEVWTLSLENWASLSPWGELALCVSSCLLCRASYHVFIRIPHKLLKVPRRHRLHAVMTSQFSSWHTDHLLLLKTPSPRGVRDAPWLSASSSSMLLFVHYGRFPSFLSPLNVGVTNIDYQVSLLFDQKSHPRWFHPASWLWKADTCWRFELPHGQDPLNPSGPDFELQACIPHCPPPVSTECQGGVSM